MFHLPDNKDLERGLGVVVGEERGIERESDRDWDHFPHLGWKFESLGPLLNVLSPSLSLPLGWR